MKGVIIFIYFLIRSSVSSTVFKTTIIGGENADIKIYPYQVSLRLKGKHFCGGAIISEYHILTAAHCVTEGVKTGLHYDLTISAGTTSSKMPGISYRVAKIMVHPGWSTKLKKPLYAKDIAVITLINKIHFDDKQQKIGLATHHVASGDKALVTGWGYTSGHNQVYSEQLQKIIMKILDSKDCQSRFNVALDKTQICADHRTGRGACSGDSGSPVVFKNEIIGIVSWVINGECGGDTADVLTSVYDYKDFIESATGLKF